MPSYGECPHNCRGHFHAFVYIWAKYDTPGQPPPAGGFLRCDSPDELDAFLAQCEERGIATKVERS